MKHQINVEVTNLVNRIYLIHASGFNFEEIGEEITKASDKTMCWDGIATDGDNMVWVVQYFDTDDLIPEVTLFLQGVCDEIGDTVFELDFSGDI